MLPAVEIANHFVFERDGFVALVERRAAGFGGIGAAGLLTEKGVAPLMLRGGEAFFVAKGFEQRASVEEVEQIRRFQADLKSALRDSV